MMGQRTWGTAKVKQKAIALVREHKCDSSAGADSDGVPPGRTPQLLDEISFPLQDESPEVIFSYASRTDGEKGTAWMWMLASLLRDSGITSYNARQTPAGGDWLKEWFGRMPDCKICVAMFSPAYFESDKCKNELYEAAGSHLEPQP